MPTATEDVYTPADPLSGAPYNTTVLSCLPFLTHSPELRPSVQLALLVDLVVGVVDRLGEHAKP